MPESPADLPEKPQWPLRLAALALIVLSVIGLVSCTSPEAKLKKRQETMEKFATQVAKQLYDKNPETVRESMTLLFREELSDSVKEKLQREKMLPNTELGIVKILTEAEENHTTNKVEVTTAKSMATADKEVVPIQVSGQVVTKTEGKPDVSTPFNIHIVVKLPIVAGAWPQVIDVTGMSPNENKKPPQKDQPGKKKKTRRR